MSTVSDTAEKLRELIDKWDGLADDTDASPSDLRRVERAILVIVTVRAPAILTALTAAADVERLRAENEDQARRLKRLRELLERNRAVYEVADIPTINLFQDEYDEICDILNIER